MLGELGRFLVAMTDADGKVFAFWQPSTQTASGTSIFSTGETWFALNRLERLFPDAGWREPAERVGRYVMQHRDDAEDVFPPTSDHWGAYAIDEMQHWATPPSAELSEMTDAYAERLAGIFGVQVRFESQRTDSGVNVLLRGHQALPSGLGTLGEGLGALARYEDARGRPDDAAAIADRMACAVGMLVDRQVTSDDVRADGAWFHSDVTQMDDQQHPLVDAGRVWLTSPPRPCSSRDSRCSPRRTLLVSGLRSPTLAGRVRRAAVVGGSVTPGGGDRARRCSRAACSTSSTSARRRSASAPGS